MRALPKPALVDEELVCACSCSLAGALVYLSSDFRRWADGPSLLYGAQGWLFNGPTGTIASVSVGLHSYTWPISTGQCDEQEIIVGPN